MTKSGGEPGSRIFQFVDRDIPTGDNNVRFDAPGGARLDPNTNYHIVFEARGGSGSDSEAAVTEDSDQAGYSGWWIHNDRHWMSTGGDWVNDDDRIYKISVRGFNADDEPYVASIVRVGGPPTGGVYQVGDFIVVTVLFSEAVDVTGVPRVPLRIGGQTRYADYFSKSESAIIFAYTVQIGDEDDDGYHVDASSLELNGGTIRRAGTTVNADLDHPSLPTDSDHKVDALPPSVTGAEVSTDGRTIVLTFSEDLDHPTYTTPIRGAFTVTVDGTENSIVNVSGINDKVTLSVSRRIGQGQAVVVSYDQSDAGSEALEASGGREVADFTTGTGGVPAVDNNSTLDRTPPVLTTAAVPTTGGFVALTFNESVVSAVGNLADALRDAFTVTVDGVERRVTGLAALTQNSVQVAVESTIHAGQTVTVSYDASAAGASALADGAGNDVVSFTTGENSVPAVTNNSTVASAKLDGCDRANGWPPSSVSPSTRTSTP